ncbi:MAG TPA: OB-fold nucleic acid binding domain-containing protein [Deltaproteobacteria bacterium]|jgi:3'-5' exoribonuclease|nr:OB-fold nucleic acid binding domain-containing protein [Deltaproteobacteria bacterium]HQI00845.1 OB-fold nucleic acid binding domain-containing protein [Deltaproteobacteria bacterium]HQJ07758.1 OB-fold nucleic acid binding domain-containing protein [Deltaproteobacteria bacterium]
MISKGRYVAELHDGEGVRAVFMVSERRVFTTRNGKPYAKILLTDKTGDILGIVWDDAKQQVAPITLGDVVGIRGNVESYEGRLQIRIEKVVKLKEEEVEMSALVPMTGKDIPTMMAEVDRYVAAMRNKYLKTLVERIFAENGVRDSFQKAPAAKGIHHNYRGGLLEHTLFMLRSLQAIFPVYEHLGLNKDLLIAGAILHDVGKIYEYSFSKIIEMTPMGRLVGHVYLSTHIVDQAITKIEGFPDELRLQLLHVILGHHGQLEYGSPKLPMTREAMLLHMLDDLDAKLIGFSSVINSTPDEEDFSSFSEVYNRYLYTRVYEEDE